MSGVAVIDDIFWMVRFVSTEKSLRENVVEAVPPPLALRDPMVLASRVVTLPEAK